MLPFIKIAKVGNNSQFSAQNHTMFDTNNQEYLYFILSFRHSNDKRLQKNYRLPLRGYHGEQRQKSKLIHLISKSII